MCVSKKDLALYPEMRREVEAQLVKLTNSTISKGKYVRSGQMLFHLCLCVSMCAHLHQCISSLLKCVCFGMRTLSPDLWAVPSMRLEYHGFSHWSEELIKESMRG